MTMLAGSLSANLPMACRTPPPDVKAGLGLRKTSNLESCFALLGFVVKESNVGAVLNWEQLRRNCEIPERKIKICLGSPTLYPTFYFLSNDLRANKNLRFYRRIGCFPNSQKLR